MVTVRAGTGRLAAARALVSLHRFAFAAITYFTQLHPYAEAARSIDPTPSPATPDPIGVFRRIEVFAAGATRTKHSDALKSIRLRRRGERMS
jgi:hypothetical protein